MIFNQPFLHSPHCFCSIKCLPTEDTSWSIIDAYICVHLGIFCVTLPLRLLKTRLWVDSCLHRKFEEAMRAQPNWIYLHLTVLKLERICDLVQRNEHILNNMHFMIIISYSVSLSGLKKR